MTEDTLELTYDIYIAAAPAKVWNGLIDPKMTKQYVYGTEFDGRVEQGASYAYVAEGGFKVVDGEILEVKPHQRLAMSWAAHWDENVAKDAPSRVSYELSEPAPGITKLRIVHDGFRGQTATYAGSVGAWALVLSSLKSLIETGHSLKMGTA